MDRNRMKAVIKAGIFLCAVCLCIQLLTPICAQADGLFDALLGITPESAASSEASADGASLLTPIGAQSGGLFDALLGITPEPAASSETSADGAADPLLVALMSVLGDAKTIEDAGALIVRFDVSGLSLQQVLEKLEAVQQTGFVGMAWDSGVLELRYPQQGDALASAAAPGPTKAPESRGTYADSNVCSYCGGSGMCSHCSFGECMRCFGSGESECERCFGHGTCPSCDGMGGELRYVFGGDNKWVTCSRCGGSGMCRSCNGMGSKQCSYCHGSGDCAYCDGTGDCPYCHGTGTC